jgi:hypothetical protein
MSKALLDGLGIGVNMKFVFYQFPRQSKHVSRFPCEDVPLFLEEFDECDFLFKIQIVSHMSDLRGVTRGQWDSIPKLVLWLDGQL